MNKRYRPDKDGSHKSAFERNKKKIFMTRTICAICGMPVDFTLKYPNPMSATIDHIIPIKYGGHPSDIDNLQLAHLRCNLQKSTNIGNDFKDNKKDINAIGNNDLPLLIDWTQFDKYKEQY